MKKVTLVRGLPGAGKTTFAKKLRDEITASGTTAIWLESSMYTSETGIRILSTSQTPVVTGWLLNKVSDALSKYDNIIVARVAMDARDITHFANLAHRHNAEFEVIRLNTHWVDKIPAGILDAMKKDFEDYPGETVIAPVQE